MKNDLLLSLSTEFATRDFNESDALDNPFDQFDRWFDAAVAAELPEPHAMVLATSTVEGKPSARVVLLRNCDERGFVFFTNYGSQKGQEMMQNPQVQLLFYWHVLGRQIRIEGTIEKVSREVSQEYFSTRPIDSRIGAWASRQSTEIQNREELERAFKEFEKEFSGKEIPLPPFWGGYRVLPTRFEFWQGRENRLHDRIVYARDAEVWRKHRVSP